MPSSLGMLLLGLVLEGKMCLTHKIASETILLPFPFVFLALVL